MQRLDCDVLIVGGGTGGVGAALALLDKGLRVVMTEPTAWVGGQLTSQAVPPDENPWIEQLGCTARYRAFRDRVRRHYRLHENLTEEASRDALLNVGGGWVSHLCHSPAVAHSVICEMLSPGVQAGDLAVLLETVPVGASVVGDAVESVTVRDSEGVETEIWASYVLDATELGDLLPMTGTAYALGAESKEDTGEPNALDGPAEPENIQSFTWCAAVGFDPDPSADYTIPEPEQYSFWRDYQPDSWSEKLLSFWYLHAPTGRMKAFPLFSDNGFDLFSYRQVVKPEFHTDGREAATIMNWPMNDFDQGHVVDVSSSVEAERLEAARQLTLSVMYWLQTEHGYRGLHFRPDLTGSGDGLAQAVYHREGRRLKALKRIVEQDVAAYCHPSAVLAPVFEDSVGIGAYRIDLHPAANGAGPIDTSTLPFTIPLGALIPERTRNLIAAGKCIGTTHITNGCYRLHPIEWSVGEAAGLLAWECLRAGVAPAEVWGDSERLAAFQELVRRQGIPTEWPVFRAL